MTLPKTMKQWYWPGKVSGYPNLQLREVPLPTPGPGEVLVKIHAVSLNFRELMIANNMYMAPLLEDLTPGCDPAGEVVALGPGAGQWVVGDRVVPSMWLGDKGTGFEPELASTALGGEIQGSLTEYRTIPSAVLVKIPQHMSYEEASTLACAGGAAYKALLDNRTPIQAGETVVLQGTGGVSLFAAQIAVAAGARVILTSSSDEKLKTAKALGVHDVINYKTTPDWQEQVRTLTGGRGAEMVVDVAGGPSMSKSLRAVRFGGQIIVIGALSGIEPPSDILIQILIGNVTVRGILTTDIVGFRKFVRLLDLHKIKPVVGKVFEFGETKEAYACLEKQDFVGKVVIRVSKD